MLHKKALLGDIHILPNWVVADEAERLALELFADDVYKCCWQEDTNVGYILLAVTPTWQALIGAQGPAGQGILAGTVDPTTEGNDGDFYLRSDTYVLFGPKTAGSWGTGTDLVGVDAPIGIPQNSQSADYTCVLTDNGKHIFHPSTDTTGRTFTIPANASVAFDVGAAITFVNQDSAGEITIAITTDTLVLAGAGTTGSRTLAANGIATALKVTATEWIINGVGLT